MTLCLHTDKSHTLEHFALVIINLMITNYELVPPTKPRTPVFSNKDCSNVNILPLQLQSPTSQNMESFHPISIVAISEIKSSTYPQQLTHNHLPTTIKPQVFDSVGVSVVTLINCSLMQDCPPKCFKQGVIQTAIHTSYRPL